MPPVRMGVCVCVCERERERESMHVQAHVYVWAFVHISGGVAREKHTGVVGRADRLKHKTANSKERGIF